MAAEPPWTMHVIDNPNFRLPNGLDSADADGDGDPDIESGHGFQFGDLDGDGDEDIVVHLENAVYLFRNRGSREGGCERDHRFDRIVIPKPEQARWRARMIRLGDVDGDGVLEMVGALIHHAGKLPSTKTTVFWAGPLNGEKWDQAVLDDLDGDGDLDIAANCEEFDSPFKVHLAVVWFENPG